MHAFTPPQRHDITGLVLAGGRGRRMGAVQKALQPLDGQALLSHVLDRLSPQVQTVMVNTSQGQALRGFERLHLRWLADVLPDFQGPMVGVLAGLQNCPTPWMLTVPCDAPCLPLDLQSRLAANLASAVVHQDAAVACTAVSNTLHMEPMFSLLHKRWAAALASAISQGERSMQRWLRSVQAAPVLFEDKAAFFNVNTLDDLRR